MATSKFGSISAQESGIGGFLLLFVIVAVLSLGSILFQITGYWVALSGDVVALYGRIYAPYPSIVIGELVFRERRGSSSRS